jgi:hypothetical protein
MVTPSADGHEGEYWPKTSQVSVKLNEARRIGRKDVDLPVYAERPESVMPAAVASLKPWRDDSLVKISSVTVTTTLHLFLLAHHTALLYFCVSTFSRSQCRVRDLGRAKKKRGLAFVLKRSLVLGQHVMSLTSKLKSYSLPPA